MFIFNSILNRLRNNHIPWLTDLQYYGFARPNRLLHIGANAGQEATAYAAKAIEAWHVEANPSTYQMLSETCRSLPNQHSINACITNKNGENLTFFVANNDSLSSSILRLGRHMIAHPSVKVEKEINIESTTVDGLLSTGQIPSNIEFLILDVQGAEALVLSGAKSFLESQDLIGMLVETAVTPLYEDGCSYLEICELLASFNFHLAKLSFNREGWCDALFLRKYWP